MKKIALVLTVLFTFYGVARSQSKPACDVSGKLIGTWVLNDMTFEYNDMTEEELKEAQLLMKEEVGQMIGKVKFIFDPKGIMHGESTIEDIAESSSGTWDLSPDCKQVMFVMDGEENEKEVFDIVSVDPNKLVLRSAMEDEGSFSLILRKE